MPDQTTTIETLKQAVARFVAERHWQPYHSPKNLAMALTCETAELVELFQWVDSEESRRLAHDPARREAIGDELADVFNALLCLCVSMEFDLSDELLRKMQKNARKYPAPANKPGPADA